MYLVRIGDLKKQLAARPLPGSDAARYLALILLFWPATTLSRGDTTGLVSSVVMTAVVLGGTLHAYRRNGGPGGVRFLERYVSIFCVTWIRLLPIALAVIVGLSILGAELAEALSRSAGSWGTVGLVLAYYLLSFQRIGAHIRDVANGTP